MRVLVTGAFGYFGTALVRRLVNLQSISRVFAVGRWRPDAASLPMYSSALEALECDVRGLTAAYICERQPNAIVHLAGGGTPGGKIDNPLPTLRDNLDSATHIASIAPEGVKLILASSIYVYGPSDPSEGTPRWAPVRAWREEDTCQPDTLYGCIKHVAEHVWWRHGGVSLRFAHIYGAIPNARALMERRQGMTEKLARAALRGAPFTRHGTGLQKLDLLHINDACDAVCAVLAVAAPSLLPKTINFGGGAPVTLNQVIDTFAHFAPELKTDRSAVEDPPDRVLDISLAEMLGWTPKVSLEQGVKGLLGALGANIV